MKHIAAAVALFASGIAAQAEISVFTSRAAWESAVAAPIVTETFDSITPYYFSEPVNPFGPFSVVLDRVGDPDQIGVRPVNGGGSRLGLSLVDPDTGLTFAPSNIRFMLETPTVAFGADFDSVARSSDTTINGEMLVEIAGETIDLALLVDDSGDGFVGFISTTPFDTASFTYQRSGNAVNDYFSVDNFAFQGVPAPGAVTILLGSCAALIRRRR